MYAGEPQCQGRLGSASSDQLTGDGGVESSPATTFGPVSHNRRPASSSERPPFEVRSRSSTASGSTTDASKSSGETWAAVAGGWGPCGITLGSTGVGNEGTNSPRFIPDAESRPAA